jgi:cholesterol transport system auxiliary component
MGRGDWGWGGALLALLVAGCAPVGPLGQNGVQTHVLAVPAAPRAVPVVSGPVLLVSPPGVRAGLDSRRIAYVQRPFELSYFARSEWADTPARMLQPLLVQSLEGSGAFRAVVAGPSPAATDLRLETEVLALQQEFLTTPSVARVSLRAQVVDPASRRVVATETFEAVEPADSADPYSGVVASNRALARVLADVTAFVSRLPRSGAGVGGAG